MAAAGQRASGRSRAPGDAGSVRGPRDVRGPGGWPVPCAAGPGWAGCLRRACRPQGVAPRAYRGALPLVREAADLLWRGSLDWHRRTARIAGIERQVGQGLGDSDFSALVQVQLLARDCRWLLDECTTRLIP
ncbi:DUF6415 family natural product biosynthesis protein [Streptomyces sp. MCA2]|uniref:DUF6415 family natural product biosynthesis protein n=1 Tax=Streptomyces sp. MCA2 TaxID=2944805 RepID=UPI0035ABA987